MAGDELPLYQVWSTFVRWLFGRTEKFPRRVRASVSARLEALALDTLSDIVEARYTRERRPILQRINLRLEVLRAFLRLCHEERWLPHEGYEYGARLLVDAGRMVGGWIRSESREPRWSRRGAPPVGTGAVPAPTTAES